MRVRDANTWHKDELVLRPMIGRRDFLQSAAAIASTAMFREISSAQTPSRAHDDSFEFQGRHIRVGDFNLHVIDVGTGPAVLLLHGFPGSALDGESKFRHSPRQVTV